MSNTLVSRYEIIKPLGAGGFGETFLARDLQMPSLRLAVVKKLRPANAGNLSRRFNRPMLGTLSSAIDLLARYFFVVFDTFKLRIAEC
jgi:serine/threonine protein kinase